MPVNVSEPELAKFKTLPYDARCEAMCESPRERLYLTALALAPRIADCYESMELGQLVDGLGLNDRASDIWKPLLAIASVTALAFSALSVEAQDVREVKLHFGARAIGGGDAVAGDQRSVQRCRGRVAGVAALVNRVACCRPRPACGCVLRNQAGSTTVGHG